MYRYAIAFCIGSTLLFGAGCGGSDKKSGPGLPRHDVKGTVSLDGNPMPEGQIIFSVAGEPVGTMDIKNGSFTGQAAEGKNKVEFHLMKPDKNAKTDPPPKINVLPKQWHTESKEYREVKAGTNEFEFKITSK